MNSQKRILLGYTVLSRSIQNSRLDGISIYTRAILRHFSNNTTLSFHACTYEVNSLRQKPPEVLPNTTIFIPKNYSQIAAWQTLLNSPHPVWRSFEPQFDLFHATDHLIPKLKGKPVVASVMDAIPLTQPQLIRSRMRHFKAYAFRKAIQSATRIITISDFSAKELVEYAGIPESKIDITPLACDQRFFSPIEPLLRSVMLQKLGLERPYLLFVGTIQPRKNVERLILAYDSLPTEIRSNHDLVIAGGLREDMLDLLSSLTKERSVGNVRWLQYVSDDDLVALMQSCTALVIPSLYEGFGLPVLEGFASGVPVLSSNSSSLPEVCAGAALEFDPYSIEAMCDAMLQVIESTDLAQSLVRKGKERVKNFSWERTGQLTLESYYKAM